MLYPKKVYHHIICVENRGIRQYDRKISRNFMDVQEWDEIKVRKLELSLIHEPRSIVQDIILNLEFQYLLKFQRLTYDSSFVQKKYLF